MYRSRWKFRVKCPWANSPNTSVTMGFTALTLEHFERPIGRCKQTLPSRVLSVTMADPHPPEGRELHCQGRWYPWRDWCCSSRLTCWIYRRTTSRAWESAQHSMGDRLVREMARIHLGVAGRLMTRPFSASVDIGRDISGWSGLAKDALFVQGRCLDRFEQG